MACSHAEGDRHQRHALLTRRALEGYVLLAGRYGDGAWSGTLAAEVSREFLRVARAAGREVWRVDWTHFTGDVPGAGALVTWATVEGCEETAAQQEEWYRNGVAAGVTGPTWQSKNAARLRALAAAAREVERGVPWWAAIRAQAVWRELPRWCTG